MTEEIKYRIIFSGRRSISLTVSPDKGVVVRAPHRTSLSSIQKFVEEKSGWIRKHLDSHDKLTRLNHGKKYIEGEKHLYLGRELVLKLRESDHESVIPGKETIEIFSLDTGDPVRIRSQIELFYRRMAKEYLTAWFNEILDIHKERRFFPVDLVIKPLKSRWGSCSNKGTITLSSELIKLDPALSEYVIIHELCHLKHHNHGREFYLLLGELVPDFRARRKVLRNYLTK